MDRHWRAGGASIKTSTMARATDRRIRRLGTPQGKIMKHHDTSATRCRSQCRCSKKFGNLSAPTFFLGLLGLAFSASMLRGHVAGPRWCEWLRRVM